MVRWGAKNKNIIREELGFMPNVTLEYSCKQGFFHISEIDVICRENYIAIVNGTPTDYLLIGVFNSYEEADNAQRRLKAEGFCDKANRKSRRLAEI